MNRTTSLSTNLRSSLRSRSRHGLVVVAIALAAAVAACGGSTDNNGVNAADTASSEAEPNTSVADAASAPDTAASSSGEPSGGTQSPLCAVVDQAILKTLFGEFEAKEGSYSGNSCTYYAQNGDAVLNAQVSLSPNAFDLAGFKEISATKQLTVEEVPGIGDSTGLWDGSTLWFEKNGIGHWVSLTFGGLTDVPAPEASVLKENAISLAKAYESAL
jgi:hypothetical protein